VKLLLDTCVWSGAVDQLRSAGHDVIWVGNWTEDPGDDAVMAFAYSEQRIVITIDKDFGELAVLRGMPHHGIVRIVNFSAKRHGDVSLEVLKLHGVELLTGALVTAEPGRIRIRPPESKETAPVKEVNQSQVRKLDDSELLSEKNWQRAVIEAIEELPNDIRESVGYSPPTARTMDVTVSVEPIDLDDERESHVARIEITWWWTMREKGWPAEFEDIYGLGGIKEEQADWPIITLHSPASNCEYGQFPGRADVASLKGEVQLAILEEMWCGGGLSLVTKDKQGRFKRFDGSPILEWQFSEEDET